MLKVQMLTFPSLLNNNYIFIWSLFLLKLDLNPIFESNKLIIFCFEVSYWYNTVRISLLITCSSSFHIIKNKKLSHWTRHQIWTSLFDILDMINHGNKRYMSSTLSETIKSCSCKDKKERKYNCINFRNMKSFIC